MPTVSLTARNITKLPPLGARAEYWDASVPGFGLRVTSSGVRTWTVRYRHQGRLWRMTIGRYPKLSLAVARKNGRDTLRRAGLGEHPAGLKQAARAREHETIAALVTEYEKHAKDKRSWSEERRILHKEVLPTWRHRLVSEITRRDVRSLVDAKAETARVMANRLLSRVSRLLAFAVEHDWIDANPASRIPKPGGREQSRTRVLSADELRLLWAALLETNAQDDEGEALPRLSATLNDVFRVMLLTAQRPGEVARMRWADVDLTTKWWLLPASDTKTATDHRVPLTAPAIAILKARRKSAPEHDVYVFGGAASVAARAKKAAARLSRGLPFSFRAHDLRRTAASGMAAAGVPRDHVAHVLNHRSVTFSTVTAIYDRYRYDAEKKAGLERWAQVVMRTVNSKRKASALTAVRQFASGAAAC